MYLLQSQGWSQTLGLLLANATLAEKQKEPQCSGSYMRTLFVTTTPRLKQRHFS
jgi:hypothetical protein